MTPSVADAAPVEQMGGEDGMSNAHATAVGHGLICLASREHLTRESLEHVLEKPHAAGRESLTCEGKPAIARVHQE
jgi:hypothetical protein